MEYCLFDLRIKPGSEAGELERKCELVRDTIHYTSHLLVSVDVLEVQRLRTPEESLEVRVQLEHLSAVHADAFPDGIAPLNGGVEGGDRVLVAGVQAAGLVASADVVEHVCVPRVRVEFRPFVHKDRGLDASGLEGRVEGEAGAVKVEVDAGGGLVDGRLGGRVEAGGGVGLNTSRARQN